MNNRITKQIKKAIKTTGIILLVLIGSAIIYREFNFIGPVVAVQPVPEQGIIDMHVHVSGLGNGCDQCFISEPLKNNFRFEQFLSGFNVTMEEVTSQGDQILIDKLAHQLRASNKVAAAVLLALDGVVGDDGELDLSRTEFYIPNDYIVEQIRRYPDLFLLGASVNPYRNDAIERLEKVKAQGAVLIKWIPNIQAIDPADEALVPFYQKMKTLGLVLLSHTGEEHSFSQSNDEYGDPLRLRLPLSLGVKVIAAHIATTGSNGNQSNYQRILPMFDQWPNLYADISSLTQINKLGYMDKALQESRLQGRMVYGSDFPLINMVLTSPFYFPLNLSLAEMFRINSIENAWDRDVALKQALGASPETFVFAEKILGIRL